MKILKLIIQWFLLGLILAVIISLIIGGIYSSIITVLPTETVGWGARKLCFLGYRAHCAFTPFSTLISVGMILLGIYLLKKFINYLKSKQKAK